MRIKTHRPRIQIKIYKNLSANLSVKIFPNLFFCRNLDDYAAPVFIQHVNEKKRGI